MRFTQSSATEEREVFTLPDCVLQKEVGAGLEHKSLGIRSRSPYSPIRDLKARAVFWLLCTFSGGLVVSVVFPLTKF